MNTFSIVLIALKTAHAAVRTVDGFVKDEEASKILDQIGDALELAIQELEPFQRAAQEAAAHDKPI